MPGGPDWDRLADVFTGLADLSPDQQAAALGRIDDPVLREQVASMLAAERSDGHPLDQGVEAAAADLIGRAPVAQLNHPAIARFHDADSFADGTPWLAMEYVPGVPVTEFEGYTMGRMT